jgi:peptidoglycan/xylan/chitin deacetylase (PgdA/CDA1 family)
MLALCLSWGSPAGGGERKVAVTIDDLPAAGGAGLRLDLPSLRGINQRMLAALTKHEVPAIGFVNESRLHVPGEMDERIAMLQSWLEVPLRDYQDDVLHGEVITRRLLEARGEEPRFFRFPYNHRGTDAGTRDAFDAFLKERGYRVAPFTVEHVDYAFNSVYTRAREAGDTEAMAKVRSAYLDFLDTAFEYFEGLSVDLWGREIAQIFLIHVNEINAECMGEMLERLVKRGYSFVSLAEALEDEAYDAPDDYLGRFGPSWLHRWTITRGLPMRRDEPDPPAFILEAY